MTVIADRVRGYELLGRAGQDGPWTVHLARPASGGSTGNVLVKTLACHRVDKRALKRIVRGFAFPEELSAHPGVIPVLEVGATGDGRPYLVTPPHDGLTLAERPGRGVPMPLEQATGLLRAVARVVAATHAAGGAHGRVKPENVVMTAGGVVLTGYAMSALMSIVELPDGTLPSVHASPEELEGRPPVPASDVYALGSMAYELLAGRPAFAPDGPGSTARFVLGVLGETPPPLPPSVPASLARVIAQAMSKDPAARPTADSLATAARTSARPHTTLPPAQLGQPRTARLPESEQPLTACLPEPEQPLTARLPGLEGEVARYEGSGPRELVWTVDPDRSQVRPPAGPRPFLPPATEATPPSQASHPQDPPSQGPPSQGPPSQGPQQAARKGSKVPLVVAGVSALAVLAGAGSVALAMSGAETTTVTAENQPTDTSDQPGDPATDQPTGEPPQADQRSQPSADPGTPGTPGTTASAPATSPPPHHTTNPATIAAYRPKNLKLVSDNGATVTLSWKAVRKNDYPTIIQQAPGDRLLSAPAGSTTYPVGGLDPATGYCFKVGTVVALGQPSSVAWSSALCIRGAAEADPDEEVQPPIVLPLATPPPASPEQG
ncbi:serine/threonine protein kinase [Nonomuraea rubra]|uniref:non-specific serine/threonine protein kinase n=1 Tax=Nonomuraea rubra TaxID=46180 RepID=A0A7X0P2F2_9ACTN|nr:protein kinase [Nonomuraea rubra]MBB6554018.1 serine/threonine protein kinase [Nonomuraea rubra]